MVNGTADSLTCIDLFCGIGGFNIAATNLGAKVIFASDIDKSCQKAYQHNFNLNPVGDIVSVSTDTIPNHDLLLAGFPCQPFSIIGRRQGLTDPRGTMFLEILRIVRAKRPSGIILENVKQLAVVEKGAILQSILQELQGMGYQTDWKILNALDFGLPQRRERTLIVATLQPFDNFPWPIERLPMRPLAEILEKNLDSKYFVSDQIRMRRHTMHTSKETPSIWHENKAGHISSHPWSCALRANASYNYLLVNGERRLTPREMLRLQGFPDSFEIVCTDSQTRKQVGNSVPVPMIEAAIRGVIGTIKQPDSVPVPRL